MRIGIDLMGGDRPFSEVQDSLQEAALEFGSSHQLVAFIEHSYMDAVTFSNSIEIVEVGSFIEMHEPPLLAVRRKKDSSMAEGMRQLAAKKIDAFVSLGNTGALVTTAMLTLPKMFSIERPALLVSLPTAQEECIVLDVGANIAPKAEHLIDNARMAIALFSILGRKVNSFGLLNVGAEEIKGTRFHKQVYQLLEKAFPNQFKGNVEGWEVFKGELDFLITDGFTGNVFLKTCEAVAFFLTDYLEQKMSTYTGKTDHPLMDHLHEQFNYSQRPGALLCGVGGLVIKCHGHSTTKAIVSGIKGALHFAQKNVIEKMQALLNS